MTQPAMPAHTEQSEFTFSTLFSLAGLIGDHCSSWSLFPNNWQKVNSLSMQFFNSTASFSIFTGGLLSYSGIAELNLSAKLKDFWGQVRGGLSVLTGGMQFLSGLGYLGGTLSAIGYWITSQKTALSASNVLQNIGGGLSSFSYLLGGLVVATEIKHAAECKLKLKGDNTDAILESLRQEVLDPEKGLLWRKTLSSELMQAIIESPSPETLDQVHAHLNKKLIINSIVALLSCVGFVLGVLAMTSIPISPWPLLVIGVVVTVAWIALDCMDLMETVQESKVDWWEKFILYMITIASAALVAAGTVLAQDLMFGIVSGILGFILLLVQLGVIYKMKTE